MRLLRWPWHRGWKYRIGDEVSHRILTRTGHYPTIDSRGLLIRYKIQGRKFLGGQTCYAIEDTAIAKVHGWLGEDNLQPYDPTPIPHPAEVLSQRPS